MPNGPGTLKWLLPPRGLRKIAKMSSGRVRHQSALGAGRYDDQVHADAALARSVPRVSRIDATVRPTTAGGDAQSLCPGGAREGVELSSRGVVTAQQRSRSALMHTPSVLAIVPAGSGNGPCPAFSHSLRIPAARLTKDRGDRPDAHH
jgi:hypothetical protein